MIFNNKTALLSFIKAQKKPTLLIINNEMKANILQEINFIHKCIFMDEKAYCLNDVDDFMLPLIYQSVQNIDLALEIFNALKNFTIIDVDDNNYNLIKNFYRLGCEKKYIAQRQYPNDVVFVELALEKQNIEIYKFEDTIFELYHLVHKIASDIATGVDIDNIQVVLDENLKNQAIMIFKLFEIPINTSYQVALSKFEGVDTFLETLDVNILNDIQTEARLKLLNIISKYSLEYPKFIQAIVKNTQIEVAKKNGGVKLLNLLEVDPFQKVYLVGLTDLRFFPKYLDNQLLSDKLKQKLNLKTSNDINKLHKMHLLKLITTNPNCYLSYTSNIKGDNYSYLEVLNEFIVTEKTINIFDILHRFSRYFDQYILKIYQEDYEKYFIIDDNITYLLNNIEPKTKYDNQMHSQSIVSKNKVLDLSATSIETYFKCSYSFYVAQILKVKIYNQSIAIAIGNYIHKALEDYYKEGIINYEDNKRQFCSEVSDISYAQKNQYYLQKMDKYIESLIIKLDLQHEKMLFNISGVEEAFFAENKLKLNSQVALVGKIDLVLEYDNYLAVVDYKTGNAKLRFNLTHHGLDLQNLIYFKLLKQKYPNLKFAGTYRQRVKPKVHNSIELKNDELKLNGYTYNQLNVIHALNKDNLEGIKYKKDGTLTKNALSKTLDDQQIDEQLNYVDQALSTLITTLSTGIFKINPKVNVDSCKYCTYSSICYKKNKDFEVLR